MSNPISPSDHHGDSTVNCYSLLEETIKTTSYSTSTATIGTKHHRRLIDYSHQFIRSSVTTASSSDHHEQQGFFSDLKVSVPSTTAEFVM
jgi:hypothetical protein